MRTTESERRLTMQFILRQLVKIYHILKYGGLVILYTWDAKIASRLDNDIATHCIFSFHTEGEEKASLSNFDKVSWFGIGHNGEKWCVEMHYRPGPPDPIRFPLTRSFLIGEDWMRETSIEAVAKVLADEVDGEDYHYIAKAEFEHHQSNHLKELGHRNPLDDLECTDFN